ncbi:PHD finger protein 1-like [Pseudonaja textilis]|uniref:PHD finger protein 1-like n=1 Tax=Pseudonaja textilis TaxID=8673 RepID=UPI000EA88441|nr:PHD finger protein 1-like [Pseudonaja textilis]
MAPCGSSPALPWEGKSKKNRGGALQRQQRHRTLGQRLPSRPLPPTPLGPHALLQEQVRSFPSCGPGQRRKLCPPPRPPFRAAQIRRAPYSLLSGQGRRGLGPQPRRERRHRPKAPGAALNTTEQHSARKRKRLTRALTQELVQSPVSPNQSYGGTCSTYNLSCTDARCQDSAPIRMFASFHPLANTTGALRRSGGLPPGVQAALPWHQLPPAPQSSRVRSALPPPSYPAQRLPSSAKPRPLSPAVPPALCTPASSSYFGAMGRPARREAVRILARCITMDGSVQYLVEWDG